MNQHETTTPTERKPLGRRTVLKGAAWSLPAVVAVGATPAFAATGDDVTITNVVVDDPLAPGWMIINISNQDSGVTVTGQATPFTEGGTVTLAVAVNGVTYTTIEASDTWSVSIPAESLPEGQLYFTATTAKVPTFTYPDPVIKDITRPTVDATQDVVDDGAKTGTISGTLTEDADVDVAMTTTGLSLEPATYSGTAPNITWSVTYSGRKNQTYDGSVTATDAVGNVSLADTFQLPKANQAGTFNI